MLVGLLVTLRIMQPVLRDPQLLPHARLLILELLINLASGVGMLIIIRRCAARQGCGSALPCCAVLSAAQRMSAAPAATHGDVLAHT